MKSAATLVLVMLAMSASAAVDARVLAHEGQKTQWAPTRNFSSLNARAVFAVRTPAATSPYVGEEWETAAGEKDWQYAAGNPTRFTDPSGRAPMDQLAGQESRNQATATDINRRAAAGDPVAQKIQYGAFGALGVMGSPVLLACATPAGAPVCQALGMVALGGVFTSGQPTLTGLEQQVNACVAPQSPMDSLSCGFGAGATAIGAGSVASRLAPQGRAAVASMMLESSELSLPATMARGASLEPAPLISIAEQSAAPAARAAPTPSLADLKPLYSGAFSSVSSQPSMSWSRAASRAQMNAAWKAFDPSDYYAMYGPGEIVPGFGLEPVGALGRVGTVRFNHKLKAGKTTDIPALRAEIQRHLNAWNDILDRGGMRALKQRLQTYEWHKDVIERAGRSYTKSLGSAGPGRVWPHYPDMSGGGRPRSAVDALNPADARLNSIIGGQMNRIRSNLLELPDDVTRLDYLLSVEGP